MLSVISRPNGYVLDPTPITARIEEDYSNYATVDTGPTEHTLGTGDVVYIKSRAREYNGFWTIHVQNAINFFLVQDDGTYLPYTVDADITYYVSIHEHKWSSAFLPIVYKLKSDLWPGNFVDAARGFSSYTNSGGYVDLQVSGGSLGTFNALDYIQISNASSEEVNGVWQIITKTSTTRVTINLAYGTYTFTGASIQLYKSNYHAIIKVYGGLFDHTLREYNGSRLLATLNLTPDEDNVVKFSVSEIIRATLSLENDLLLSALPNNTDAFTQFFIQYGDSYDLSDGTDITTFESSVISDDSEFVGFAALNKLEFKNLYSGYLSEYIMINSLSKFLTVFAVPVMFASSCSDECYTNDGVSLQSLSNMSQEGSAPNVQWSISSAPSVSLPSSGALPENQRTSYKLVSNISNPYIGEYTFLISASAGGSAYLSLYMLQSDDTPITSDAFIDIPPEGLTNYQVTLSSGGFLPGKIKISATATANAGNIAITLSKLSIQSKNNLNEDGPCYQDISFILDYDIPSIPSIDSFNDIGPSGGFPNKPWVVGSGEQSVSLGALQRSNFLSATIKNPALPTPTNSVYHFRVSAHGSTSGATRTGTVIISVYNTSDPPGSIPRGEQIIDIPNGLGLVSYPVTITAFGVADQVRVQVEDKANASNTITVTLIRNDNSEYDTEIFLQKEYSTRTDLQSIEYKGPGLYRVPLDLDNQFSSANISLILNNSTISETKTVEIDTKCSDVCLKLSWLNNMGGFEYWKFTAFKDNNVEIGDTGETSVNLITSWPQSYGEFADTEKRRETFRNSTKQLLVRSQNITKSQADALATIKSSPLVQILNTVYDKRTVIVDKNSFTIYNDNDKLFSCQFTITYTDDIPSQTL